MSKKVTKICAAVLCCALLIASAVTLYKTEENRLDIVSENQSYIAYAEETSALANSMGVANEVYYASTPAANTDEQTDELHRMAAEVRWIAEYNTDASRLARSAAELSKSESVKALGADATYGQMCAAALSYHQAELDSANSNATEMTVVCAAVFIISLAALAYIIVKLEYSK